MPQLIDDVRRWWTERQPAQLAELTDPERFFAQRSVMIETRAAALMMTDGLDDGEATEQAFDELIAAGEDIEESRWLDRRLEAEAGTFVRGALADAQAQRAEQAL